MSTAYVSDGYRVRLAPGVLAKALRLARVRAPLETGGLLLGAVVDGEACVLAVTGPGRKAVRNRFGFEADRGRDNRLLARVRPRLHWIGDWHTHPGGSPILSGTDEEAARSALSDKRGWVLEMVVAGNPSMRERLQVGLFTAVRGEAAIRRMEPAE
ncbi:Mov34/MPN/PAD-1 family protein [Corallococcus sp. EGB]|uniref:Mov34/MPN/PAD-1 family protein n=1 Tax=Corallococcus sp. EGB TaxID=1521117 RepID=UPI001CBDB036|nr:Mov34/MPN/PAD-1 family protein [Corallococcus sp. EGB]